MCDHFTLFDLLSVSGAEEREQTVVDNFSLWNKWLTNEHSHIQPVYMTVILPGYIVFCQTDGQSERMREKERETVIEHSDSSQKSAEDQEKGSSY